MSLGQLPAASGPLALLPLAARAPSAASLFANLGWMHGCHQDMDSDLQLSWGPWTARVSSFLVNHWLGGVKLYLLLCRLNVLCYKCGNWRPSMCVHPLLPPPLTPFFIPFFLPFSFSIPLLSISLLFYSPSSPTFCQSDLRPLSVPA